MTFFWSVVTLVLHTYVKKERGKQTSLDTRTSDLAHVDMRDSSSTETIVIS